MLGPEHEFSVVDSELAALPIVDKILKDIHGRIVNSVVLPHFTFGKEIQLHVMEVKPNIPFKSPKNFEETMQKAVLSLYDFLDRKYRASLLGTGMHPLLKLKQTSIWPHRHRQIYNDYSKVFDLERHGWLNIQSFQLNLPYQNERNGILLHNLLAHIRAYLPAIAASSPIYEGKVGETVDSRLVFYMQGQKEVPSVTGDIIPDYVFSFGDYWEKVIRKYSEDLAIAGAGSSVLYEDWVNSRGVIFRFDRKALEIRVMDEQECIKSDVALSCFIRATLRGLLKRENELIPQEVLVEDFNSDITDGLDARTVSPLGKIARQLCMHLLRVAEDNASAEEREYLPIIKKRIECGSLSEIIRDRVETKAQKTDFEEAIMTVYSELIRSLIRNQPYF